MLYHSEDAPTSARIFHTKCSHVVNVNMFWVLEAFLVTLQARHSTAERKEARKGSEERGSSQGLKL